jgi:hypothetical protein
MRIARRIVSYRAAPAFTWLTRDCAPPLRFANIEVA